MNYIIAAGLVQILISILLLFLNRRKDQSDYLLIALLACIGWHLITKFFIFTSIHNPAIVLRMHTFIQLAYGPLLYMYAIKKNDLDFIPSRLWYLFIPLIITMTLYGCTVAAFLQYPEHGDAILKTYNTIVFLPIVSSHFVFGYLAFRKSKAESQLIKSLGILLILIGVSVTILLISSSFNATYNPLIRSIIYILLSIIPILVIKNKYVGTLNSFEINSNSLLSLPTLEVINLSNSLLVENGIQDKERKLLLHPDQHLEIYATLEALLITQLLYKDENLSLEKVALASGINRHYISETLNVYAEKSFYQYINEYRIKEVIQQLDQVATQQKSVSILSIAYDCGFKTKASFNQYFKKLIGKTPSVYLKDKKSV